MQPPKMLKIFSRIERLSAFQSKNFPDPGIRDLNTPILTVNITIVLFPTGENQVGTS